MHVAFRQVRAYFRIGLGVLVLVAVGLVLFMNRNHAAPVWFFWLTDASKPVNVVWLMVCTAGGTLVSWWLLSLCRGMWRELHEARRERTLEEATRALSERAAELEERERRLGRIASGATDDGSGGESDKEEKA